MSKKRTILVVTAGFPYGESEQSFFCEEYNQLVERFDVVLLAFDNGDSIIYNHRGLGKCYKYRDNLKIMSVAKAIFAKELWDEFGTIFHSNRRVNFLCYKQSFSYIARAIGIIKNMTWIIETNSINAVYTYWGTTATLAALLIKRKKNIKVVSRLHGYDLYNERSNTGRQAYRGLFAKNCDALFFPSNKALMYFENEWGGRLFLAYLGTKEYKNIENDRNRFSIISCSNIIPLKRINLIIDALSILDSKINIEWYHIGKGELEKEIQAHAKAKLSAKKNVRYKFYGFVPNSQLEIVYEKIKPSIFITTSQTEGCPVSIQEAFAMSIPAIGTNVGGIGEEIIDGKTGILLDANPTAQEIASSITMVYKMDSDEYRSLKMNAKRIWTEKFDSRKNACEFCDILSSII